MSEEASAAPRATLRTRIGTAGVVLLGLGVLLEPFVGLWIEIDRLRENGWGPWFQAPSLEAILARWSETWSYGMYRVVWAMILLGALAIVAAAIDLPGRLRQR